MISNLIIKIMRALISILLIVAIFGPWWFDQIYVPSKYPCNSPVVRLEGDFCGVPASGFYMFFAMGTGFVDVAGRIVTGEADLLKSIPVLIVACLSPVVVLLFLFPIPGSWALVLKGNRKHLHRLQIVSLGISSFLCILWVINNMPLQKSLVLWGVWMYLGVAAVALIFELAMFIHAQRAERKAQVEAPTSP